MITKLDPVNLKEFEVEISKLFAKKKLEPQFICMMGMKNK